MTALLAVGRIARSHGVRGRVLLQPYNEASEGLEKVSALWLQPRPVPGALSGTVVEPRRYAVSRAERVHLGYLVALEGIDDRDQADVLRGSEVLIDRAELPDLDADEVYAVDLVGMQVADQAGQPRGEVVGLENAGPNDLLQVKTQSGTSLVPIALVKSIDQDKRLITIEAPEGLFEVS